MKKRNRILRFLFAFNVCLLTIAQTFGQNRVPDKLIDVVNSIKRNPDNIAAHEQYIAEMGSGNPSLVKQYDIWMQAYPKSAIVPFVLGKALQRQVDSTCVPYLLKAVQIDPKFSKAWATLAYYYSSNQDKRKATVYMREAVNADPKNADFSFYNALLYQDIEPAKFDSLMMEVVYRFPDSESSQEGLFFLATSPHNEDVKSVYFDALYDLGWQKQTGWFSTGMKYYFDYLINTKPDKAYQLATKMVLFLKLNRFDWKLRFKAAKGFMDAQKLLASNRADEALKCLDSINLGNNKGTGVIINAEESLILIKAKAMAASHKQSAAYNLLTDRYSKVPTDAVYQQIKEYAETLKIDSNTITKTISQLREKFAWKETSFTLENLRDKKMVSLSDYKGKVVLLTFWFRSCVPCIEEFEHFETVLKKINSKDVVYMAVNSGNQQEETIIPFINSQRYSFIPLRDTPNKDIGNIPYTNLAPANFIIDKKGRVVFSDFLIGSTNERTLELMITELIKEQ